MLMEGDQLKPGGDEIVFPNRSNQTFIRVGHGRQFIEVNRHHVSFTVKYEMYYFRFLTLYVVYGVLFKQSFQNWTSTFLGECSRYQLNSSISVRVNILIRRCRFLHCTYRKPYELCVNKR